MFNNTTAWHAGRNNLLSSVSCTKLLSLSIEHKGTARERHYKCDWNWCRHFRLTGSVLTDLLSSQSFIFLPEKVTHRSSLGVAISVAAILVNVTARS